MQCNSQIITIRINTKPICLASAQTRERSPLQQTPPHFHYPQHASSSTGHGPTASYSGPHQRPEARSSSGLPIPNFQIHYIYKDFAFRILNWEMQGSPSSLTSLPKTIMHVPYLLTLTGWPFCYPLSHAMNLPHSSLKKIWKLDKLSVPSYQV